MPNWCENRASITAPDDRAAQRLYDAYERQETCEEFLPVPADDPDWYSKRTARWGVKWDFGNGEYGQPATRDGLDIELSFLSAWAPPLSFYRHIASLGYRVDAVYYEPNMMFGGWFCDGVHEEVSLDVASVDDIPSTLRDAFGDDEFAWLLDGWDEPEDE